jgi:hypothetical protein
VALYVTPAARWWCSRSYVSSLSLVTLKDTTFSLYDQPLPFLSLENTSLSYILFTLLTLLLLALT